MLYLFSLFFLPITIFASAEIPSINDSDYLNSIHVIHGEWIESESDLTVGPLELKRISNLNQDIPTPLPKAGILTYLISMPRKFHESACSIPLRKNIGSNMMKRTD
jgi:hypothetical protein